MSYWIITEAYVTWRTLEVTRVALLSLFSAIGRQVRFKSKQMFCVSLHSEMKKTCCDWQWREHTQFSHPRNSFLCQRIRTTIARLPASDLSYNEDILPWQLRFWQSQWLFFFFFAAVMAQVLSQMSGQKHSWPNPVGLSWRDAGLMRLKTGKRDKCNRYLKLNLNLFLFSSTLFILQSSAGHVLCYQ